MTSRTPSLTLETVAGRETAQHNSVVLVGHESSGKSALFRLMTGEATGQEANIRGSTVQARTGRLTNGGGHLVDTPGIRVADDSATTRIALENLDGASVVLLVARATHAGSEVKSLLRELWDDLQDRRVALVLTFADRSEAFIESAAAHYRARLGVPVVAVNARGTDQVSPRTEALLAAVRDARPLRLQPRVLELLPTPPVVDPPVTVFEHRWLGPWISLACILALFAVPVWVAYVAADALQPFLDGAVIAPAIQLIEPLAQSQPLAHAILVGDYGLLTLGWYSLIWALPVVVLIGLSVAITEETGLKDRITASLDSPLRRVGLSGRDLVPVLTGFGCNVVAVLQSRSCSACTRTNCVSTVAFASACSYQIGASLSVFNAAHSPWLFAPYVAVMFVVGAIHTRVWSSPTPLARTTVMAERAFLQRPTLRGAWWRIRQVLNQFLCKAIPIFLVICLAGAILDYTGALASITRACEPLLGVLGLPPETAVGVVFSAIRKDGLLALNQQGLLASLSAGQVFVLVYLASTLSACLVTLLAVGRELGAKFAWTLVGRQAVTSLGSAYLLSMLFAST